ncbi:MAG: hypothetical protein ACOC7S_00895 [Planctomycetota bacterium]
MLNLTLGLLGSAFMLAVALIVSELVITYLREDVFGDDPTDKSPKR